MAAPGRRWWIGFGVLERKWERKTAAVDLVRRREAIPSPPTLAARKAGLDKHFFVGLVG